MSAVQTRLAKLQIVKRYWERNDIKAAILAMEKMGDHGVLADVIDLLKERVDVLTLEICTALLPLLAGHLKSDIDRQGLILAIIFLMREACHVTLFWKWLSGIT